MSVLLIALQHVPAHFAYVEQELIAAGYSFVGVDLPSHDVDAATGKLPTIDDDTEAVRKVSSTSSTLAETWLWSPTPTAPYQGLLRSVGLTTKVAATLLP